METFYLFGLIFICLFFYYYNKKNKTNKTDKKELSSNITSENNANCKRVCNGDKCDVVCD